MAGKIIVVDDDPAVLRFLNELLSVHGYQVEAYSNGNDALSAFVADPSQYQLIISDQTMPNMLGLELIQKAQEIHPVRSILCTGYSEGIDEQSAIRRGASNFLMKPFDIQQLLSIVEGTLREGE